MAKWQQRFYQHVRDAADLLEEPVEPTHLRHAIINLKLAVNLTENRDLNQAQVEDHNRAARAFNHLILLDTGLDLRPAPILPN